MVRSFALLLVTLVIATPSPARGEDHRPCVSKREFNGAQFDEPHTKGDLELKWDVKPLRRDAGPFLGWNYKACGFSIDEAYIVILVEDGANPRVPVNQLEAVSTARLKWPTATLHGHV